MRTMTWPAFRGGAGADPPVVCASDHPHGQSTEARWRDFLSRAVAHLDLSCGGFACEVIARADPLMDSRTREARAPEGRAGWFR